jgi:hypothetical protein
VAASGIDPACHSLVRPLSEIKQENTMTVNQGIGYTITELGPQNSPYSDFPWQTLLTPYASQINITRGPNAGTVIILIEPIAAYYGDSWSGKPEERLDV